MSKIPNTLFLSILLFVGGGIFSHFDIQVGTLNHISNVLPAKFRCLLNIFHLVVIISCHNFFSKRFIHLWNHQNLYHYLFESSKAKEFQQRGNIFHRSQEYCIYICRSQPSLRATVLLHI